MSGRTPSSSLRWSSIVDCKIHTIPIRRHRSFLRHHHRDTLSPSLCSTCATRHSLYRKDIRLSVCKPSPASTCSVSSSTIDTLHHLQPGHSCLTGSSCVSMPGTLTCASYTSLPVQLNYPQDVPSYRSKITIVLPCSWIPCPVLRVPLVIEVILLVSVQPPRPIHCFFRTWSFCFLVGAARYAIYTLTHG